MSSANWKITPPAKSTRACWFKPREWSEWLKGEWHGWTSNAWTEHTEPAAIIEDEKGKVHVVPATQVHFGSNPT